MYIYSTGQDAKSAELLTANDLNPIIKILAHRHIFLSVLRKPPIDGALRSSVWLARDVKSLVPIIRTRSLKCICGNWGSWREIAIAAITCLT